MTDNTEKVETTAAEIGQPAALAWTLADDEADHPQRRSWPRTVGLATGIAACGTALAAGLWFATPGLRPTSSNHPAPQTVSAAPTSEPPMPSVLPSVPDAALLDRDSRMRAIVEPQLPPKYRDGRSPELAQRICDDIAEGSSKQHELAEFVRTSPDPTITLDAWTSIVNTSVQLYCPQYN
jgi:hypothetical protein